MERLLSRRGVTVVLFLLCTGTGCEDPGSTIPDPGGGGEPRTGSLPAPRSLTAAAVSAAQIDLTWIDGGGDEQGFVVERASDASGTAGTFAEVGSVGANETTFSDIGLQEDTTYHYRVFARNDGGASEYSNVARATTLTAVTPTGCGCEPLPPATGRVIEVGTVDELHSAVEQANALGHVTILVADGTYEIRHQLFITADGVTFRSRSGNRNAVTIRGAGMSGGVPHVFEIVGDNVTVADMTIGWVGNHGIQIHGEDDADAPLVHNVRLVDTFEQMLKVSFQDGDDASSDNGIVECCLFEYSAGIGPQWYVGGVDAHQSHNWVVRDNVFRNIRSPESELAEHAVHFWSGSRNTLVERNVIVACDRGIGFGLGSRGHVAGTIRNNMVYTTRDVGIGLESSPGTSVEHNTIFIEHYDRAIEYRFVDTSGVSIVHNITNAAIATRDGGSGTLVGNVTDAATSWFVDVHAGDLHLAGRIASVVDQGRPLPEVAFDIDCQARPLGAGHDIGADEFE